jgi:Q family heterogeneous nuclear ribonucleoprotein R
MNDTEYKCPLNEEKQKEINALLSVRKAYRIVQENGQRLYGPPIDNSLPIPQRGSEVFVGRLPRDCYEDELVPMFEKIGPIYQLRLMMDFSGTNRGFAFVKYTNPLHAKEAAQSLDGCEVRVGHNIGVMLSWDNRRLFIGGIPRNKNKRQIANEMKRVTENVKDVIVYMSVYNNKNRGFAFVEYETHYAAAMARRRMAPGFKLWNNYEIRVDWADPEPELDDETMSKVCDYQF